MMPTAEDAILAFSLDSEGKAIVTGFSQYGKSLINDGTVFDLVEIPNIIYFNGDINNVRSLGSDAFRNQRGFKGMLISGFVNSIGSWALNGCSDLETLYIGSKTLNSYSVTNNPKLSNLILYEGVESTVNGALGNNPMLTSVHLPASFTSRDAGSLINASLENITVESGNESYVSLQGALFDKNKTTLVRWPASNTTFTGVFMPSVKAIARNGCMYLKRNKVILSDYITTLGMMSFYGAEIESVVLGSGVETVAIQAFSGCENLASIECHAVTPPSANSAFYGLDKPSITLSVPAESLAAYKASDDWKDFPMRYAWNGEGTFSIEDRSDRNLCPAFRIISDNGENVCTIYIRWVKENAFYDGGFLNEWKRETLEDPYQQYLYDTVTLENLQGLWYSEYEDGAGLYMVLLNIEGDKGWIFETVADRISSVWNGEGPVSIVMTNLMGDIWYPELLLSCEDGPATGGIAGIYISSVDKERFYDAGLKRWFVKITEDYGSDFENMYDSGVEYFEDGSVSIEGGNLYMITPKGTVAEDGSCADWSVKVTLQDGTEQILPHQISPDSIYIPAGDGLVYEADVNFDDLPDVLLLKGVTGAKAEVFFDCYLNQGDMLVPCRGFSEIPDAFPDDVSHQIIGTARDSANSYFELHYIIDGNAVRKIDEIRYEYDEALQDYVPKN